MKSSANSIPRRDCIYLSYCRPPTPLLLHYMRLPFDLFPLISSLRSFRSPCPRFFFLFIPLLHSVRQVIRVEVPARTKVTVGRRQRTSMAVNIASAIFPYSSVIRIRVTACSLLSRRRGHYYIVFVAPFTCVSSLPAGKQRLSAKLSLDSPALRCDLRDTE